jgi:hypothetical protein
VVCGNPISTNNLRIPMALVVALNKAIYFDSVLDKAIEVFFLLEKVTTSFAKKKQ